MESSQPCHLEFLAVPDCSVELLCDLNVLEDMIVILFALLTAEGNLTG